MNKGEIIIHKVKGPENLADAMTKYVLAGELNYHIENSGMREECGRHELAPETEMNIKNDNKEEEYEEEEYEDE